MIARMKCSVLSLTISDIGGTRHADEIPHQTSNLVVHVFTMCADIQMSCLSASNDFDPTIIMHFLMNSRYDGLVGYFRLDYSICLSTTP
jgi:hypothetical protein